MNKLQLDNEQFERLKSYYIDRYIDNMSMKDLKNKDFHIKQAHRMKDWITDMKEFIVSNESCRGREA